MLVKAIFCSMSQPTKALVMLSAVACWYIAVNAAADATFTDVTTGAGVDYLQWDGSGESASEVQYLTGGAAAGDVDGDGYSDLYVTRLDGSDILFRNRGNGTFSRAPDTAGIGTDENGMGSAVADTNGDGQLDWFVTAIYDTDGPCADMGTCNWDATGNRLYQNNGDRTFSDVTDVAGARVIGAGVPPFSTMTTTVTKTSP